MLEIFPFLETFADLGKKKQHPSSQSLLRQDTSPGWEGADGWSSPYRAAKFSFLLLAGDKSGLIHTRSLCILHGMMLRDALGADGTCRWPGYAAGAQHRAPSDSAPSLDQFSWVFSPAPWALPPLMGEDFSVAESKKSLLLVLSGEGELLASHRSALLRQWLTQALEFLITSPISPCLLSLPWGCSSPDPISVGNFHPYIPDGPTLRAAFLEGIVADLPASHPPRGEFQSRSLALTPSPVTSPSHSPFSNE